MAGHHPAAAPTPVAQRPADALRVFLGAPAFPCVGAKAALAKQSLATFSAGDLRASDHDAEFVEALNEFVREEEGVAGFSALVALFPQTPPLTEEEFETHMWRRLQALHSMDRRTHSWDPEVNDDPRAPNFGMSFGGRGFYVVGMHPNASRLARRTPFAVLAFNPHRQFRKLREAGTFSRLRDVVRARDQALQGSANPMLADHGERSEASQYSGREVGGDWRCPFVAGRARTNEN